MAGLGHLPMCPRALLGCTCGKKAVVGGRVLWLWRGPEGPAWPPGRHSWSQNLETPAWRYHLCTRQVPPSCKQSESWALWDGWAVATRQDSGLPLGPRQLTALAGFSFIVPTNTDTSFPVCMAAITHVGTQLHRHTSTNKGAFPHRSCPLGDKLRSVTL